MDGWLRYDIQSWKIASGRVYIRCHREKSGRRKLFTIPSQFTDTEATCPSAVLVMPGILGQCKEEEFRWMQQFSCIELYATIDGSRVHSLPSQRQVVYPVFMYLILHLWKFHPSDSLHRNAGSLNLNALLSQIAYSCYTDSVLATIRHSFLAHPSRSYSCNVFKWNTNYCT